MVNNIKPVDIWLIMVQVRNPNHFWDKGQIRGQFWIFKVSTMSCFSNLVRFPDMSHKKDIKMCQRRVTKKKFREVLTKGCWDMGLWKIPILTLFKVPYLSSPLSELHEIFFWWLSSDTSQMSFLWFISGNLSKFEKKDMVETLKIQNWPLLWPLS